MVKPQRRGHLYLLTGLVIGLICGVLYGWIINPTRYFDITPRSLHADFQKQYILIIAQSYQATEDLGRSYSRIRQVSDPVDMDMLRTILLEMETDPEYELYFGTVRTLINDLDRYVNMFPQANPVGVTMDQQPVEVFQNQMLVESSFQSAPTQMQYDQAQTDRGSSQAEGFFVVSNP